MNILQLSFRKPQSKMKTQRGGKTAVTAASSCPAGCSSVFLITGPLFSFQCESCPFHRSLVGLKVTVGWPLLTAAARHMTQSIPWHGYKDWFRNGHMDQFQPNPASSEMFQLEFAIFFWSCYTERLGLAAMEVTLEGHRLKKEAKLDQKR